MDPMDGLLRRRNNQPKQPGTRTPSNHCWNHYWYGTNHQVVTLMDMTKIGSVQEARAIAEVLIANPTPENFARYRQALATICRIYDCEIEEASFKVTKLIEANI